MTWASILQIAAGVAGVLVTGGVLAALVTWVGATREGQREARREHERWLRDKRLETYTRALAEAERFRIRPLGGDEQTLRQTLNEMVAAAASLELLGPAEVKRAADVLVAAVKRASDDPGEVSTGVVTATREMFVNEAKKALRVP